MGGDIAEGFQHLEKDGLYHISPGQNKYNSSFEIYLSGYDQPFVFMNPTQNDSDKLTFAHEFGHYMADYYTWGSNAGTDVLEVQSQTMEYLSLVYGEADQKLVDYQLATCLSIYVEQSAYALFEQQMYNLKGVRLSVEQLQALYERIGKAYGFDSWAWDSRDFVTVPHFYSYPMYIISYVVSNDLALQIYQQELEHPGAGLETYDAILYSDEWSVTELAKTHEMEDPLDPARLQKVKDILSTVVAH
jgi:oligoendopeptidase F